MTTAAHQSSTHPGTVNRTPHFAKYTKDVGTAEPSSQINFMIALKLRNTGWVTDSLEDVSNPKSKNYGQHLTKEEVEGMTRPTQEVFDKVINYLKSKGITGCQEGDNVKVTTTIDKTQKLFNTVIHKFSQPSGDQNDTIYKRVGTFTIPNELQQCVDIVVGF
ncbi:hypothetical protein CYY_006901 [Polysphondylium violaceum]|uniref:Peptidase S53 activation domain-containing protein n=1 Tax=Polysphondylium violaceum TaxID=133409 RepID=A0A8J4PSP9_9MYCE|nr:hypothetical protein CYY_006901 [Polysphondylium violaceum]